MVGPFCVSLALPSSESSNLDGLAQAIAHTLPASISPASPNSPPCLSLSATSVPPALASPLPHIFPSSRDSTATCPRSSAHSTLVTKLHPWASILGQGLFGILFRLPRATWHQRQRRVQCSCRHRRSHLHGPLHVSICFAHPSPTRACCPGCPSHSRRTSRRYSSRLCRLPHLRLRDSAFSASGPRRTPQTPLPPQNFWLHGSTDRSWH